MDLECSISKSVKVTSVMRKRKRISLENVVTSFHQWKSFFYFFVRNFMRRGEKKLLNTRHVQHIRTPNRININPILN